MSLADSEKMLFVSWLMNSYWFDFFLYHFISSALKLTAVDYVYPKLTAVNKKSDSGRKKICNDN